MSDHYQTLGVARDASQDEIKRAYRRLAKRWHPDRKDGDHDKMTAIVRAYRILSDPEKRAHYDETGQDAGVNQIDQQASAMLADFFSQYIEKGGEENPLPMIRGATGNGLKETRAQIDTLKQQLQKIEKRAGVVKRKKTDGLDLFAAVLEAKTTDLRMKIAAGEQHLRVIERCQLMLDEYECHIVDVPERHFNRADIRDMQDKVDRMRDQIEKEFFSAFFGTQRR